MDPSESKAIAYRIFQRVVPANAGTHTARTLASALEPRPFFTSEAKGYGSLRPQGRPAERLYEATTASTYGSIQSYAIAMPRVGRAGRTFRLLICPTGKSPISCPAPFAKIFRFALYPNHFYIPRRPVPQRGGSRSSQARDGMRWTRQRQARAGIAGRVFGP